MEKKCKPPKLIQDIGMVAVGTNADAQFIGTFIGGNLTRREVMNSGRPVTVIMMRVPTEIA